MDTIGRISWGAAVILILNSCSADDDVVLAPVDPEDAKTSISFMEDFSIKENEGEKEIKILFDRSAVSDGTINVRLHIPEGIGIQTQPASNEDLVTIQVEKGDEFGLFKILPQDDAVLKGHKRMSLSFAGMSPGFKKADNNGMVITLKDDELEGKPYSFSNGNYKMQYEYQEDGKIKKTIQNYASEWSLPHTTSYSYYSDGKIKEVKYEGFEGLHSTIFSWENGKLNKAEEFIDNVLTSYSLYDYDSKGNIGGKVVYQKDDKNEIVETFVFVYLFFESGNIYKQMIYLKVPTDQEYDLISTRTYENYLDKINLFPVNEVVPGIMTQKNLPGSYRVEENGYDLLYNFTYEFNEKGYAVKRMADGEVITYEYY